MTYGAEAERTMTRLPLVILCAVISVAALGCGACFLLTGTVPLVLLFVPTGTVTYQDHPALFWVFVASHLLVGIVSLLAAGLISRRASA
jgi:hypothetical protein